ncbi:MAG: PorT family protein [Candidatus Syntrophosphaera sp.]|nr:PorT family protein [Candidatus Syntrophosphaera sp.]
MRIMILTLLVLTMTFGLIHAESKFGPSVFGIKAGMNISRVTGDDSPVSADSHLGYHAGILMRLYISESLILQPELLYTQKGYNYKYTDTQAEVDHRIRDSFDYVEVPVLVKLNVNAGDVGLQPYAGLAVSYLVNAKSKETISNDNVSITYNNDVKEEVNALGFGFLVGADVVIMQKYLVGGRYNFGLSNIWKDGYEGGSDVQNGVLMLSLGYLFNN